MFKMIQWEVLSSYKLFRGSKVAADEVAQLVVLHCEGHLEDYKFDSTLTTASKSAKIVQESLTNSAMRRYASLQTSQRVRHTR